MSKINSGHWLQRCKSVNRSKREGGETWHLLATNKIYVTLALDAMQRRQCRHDIRVHQVACKHTFLSCQSTRVRPTILSTHSLSGAQAPAHITPRLALAGATARREIFTSIKSRRISTQRSRSQSDSVPFLLPHRALAIGAQASISTRVH